MNAPINQNISVDDLLDGTLDDLADMPEFKPFAAGAHMCKINWEQKAINDLPTVELKLTCIESMELTNPEDTAPAAGDTTNVLFMLRKKEDNGTVVRNELAEGQFKNILAALKPAFPEAKNNREIMEMSEGYEVVCVTSIRTNKKDKNNIKHYTSLDTVMLPA